MGMDDWDEHCEGKGWRNGSCGRLKSGGIGQNRGDDEGTFEGPEGWRIVGSRVHEAISPRT
eukprot:7769603-Pyramimonas_sp.AAC.1